MYCRNFYFKIAVKSSIPAWFLMFFFDSAITNFAFLWSRNDIWTFFRVCLRISNALDARSSQILKKKDFTSQIFIFTKLLLFYSEPYMTYYDHFTVTTNIGAVLEDSELLSRCLDHTFLRKCKTWFLSIFTHQILQLVDWVRTPHIRYAYQTSMMNGYEHFF